MIKDHGLNLWIKMAESSSGYMINCEEEDRN
jgi:hypothetical protein